MILRLGRSLKKITAYKLIFIITLLFLWLWGDALHIGHHYFLVTTEKKLYAMVLLTLGFLVKFIFFDDIMLPHQKPSDPLVSKKLAFLKGQFKGAVHFLKNKSIFFDSKKISLDSLPWYLLIGPPQSGKTTLLIHSKINYILAKQFKSKAAESLPTESCEWWVTSENVIIDVPSYFLRSKKTSSLKQMASATSPFWQALLKFIHQDHKNKLSGIIITLPLSELLTNKDNILLSLSDLKQRIKELKATFKDQLTFFIMITQCDHLPGFFDYFDDYSAEECTQFWGVQLHPFNRNETPIQTFTHRFDALIKRINKQLIWKLHQERNSEARVKIKDFPLQLEKLKQIILTTLKSLNLNDLIVNGIYLTSSCQPTLLDTGIYTKDEMNPSFSKLLSPAKISSRPYFIKQALLYGLQPANVSQMLRPFSAWNRKLPVAIACFTVIIAGFIFSDDFERSRLENQRINLMLTQYHQAILKKESTPLSQSLPLLNTLQTAANPALNSNVPFLHLFTFYSHKSQNNAAVVYNQALKTLLLPEIKNQLESALVSDLSHQSPENIYNTLMAYLMLGDPKHQEEDYLIRRLQKLGPNPLNAAEKNSLSTHLQHALAHSSVTLNNDLISSVRQKLTSLPLDKLAFVILKNYHNEESTINLGTQLGNIPLFTINAVVPEIPTLFTAEAFNKVISHDTELAAFEALKGNWVLGKQNPPSDPNVLPQLISSIEQHYISNYVDIWESLLANIKLTTPENLTETDAMIAELTGDKSPLIQLLGTIKENTSYPLITSASPKLKNLSIVLAEALQNQSSRLYQIFLSLRELHDYLIPALNETNGSEVALKMAMDRMQDSANDPVTKLYLNAIQSPEPIKTWLNVLATQSWKFILQTASSHLESDWQKTIIKPFHLEVSNRFPLDIRSKEFIDNPHLTQFFGNKGLLPKFYSLYLKPFVNETSDKWQWRAVNNQTLPFSDNALREIQRALQKEQGIVNSPTQKGTAKLNPDSLGHIILPEQLV